MANSAAAQCYTAANMAEEMFRGNVDEKAVDNVIKNPQSKARFARGAATYDEAVSKIRQFGNSYRDEAFSFWKDFTGTDPTRLGASLRDPESILGPEAVRAVEALYLDHVSRYGRDAKQVWNQLYKPQVQRLKAAYLNGVPPQLKHYATQYFDAHLAGADLYGNLGKSNPMSTLAKNAVGNLVAWNPLIATLNAFEFLPKAAAFAEIVAGPGGSAYVMKAMRRYAQKTGLNFAKRVDDYDRLGIYGENKGFQLLELTENPLRGMGYELGEVLREAGFDTNGRIALEKVAFVPRFGNRANIYSTLAGADSVALMRFTIGAWKMYGGMVQQALQGNPGAITGLLLFSAITAVQSGGSSAIPSPIALLMDKIDPSMREEFDQWTEDSLGFNLAKKMGIDIGDKAAPLPSFAPGVAYSILTQDVAGGAKNIATGIGEAVQGEPALGAAKTIEGLMGVAQIKNFPGINLTTKRMATAVANQLEASGQLNPKDLSLEFLQQNKLIEQ